MRAVSVVTDSTAAGPETGQARKEKLLLYAIISDTSHLLWESIGIGGTSVSTITEAGISAIVSDLPGPRLRPERRNIAAQQAVLNQLMEFTTPLPAVFGTIADSEEAVREMLLRNRHALLKQMNRVKDKVEMILRVSWDVPNIFEYFVLIHSELRVARDRLFGTDCHPSQEDKLEIGRLFERLLEERRDAHAEAVEKVLSCHCAEVKRNKCRNEMEVMNLACLVAREAKSAFEARVFDAAKLFDNNFAFDYSGPWPPYNFVELNLEL